LRLASSLLDLTRCSGAFGCRPLGFGHSPERCAVQRAPHLDGIGCECDSKRREREAVPVAAESGAFDIRSIGWPGSVRSAGGGDNIEAYQCFSMLRVLRPSMATLRTRATRRLDLSA
jgi:hypothetical protein